MTWGSASPPRSSRKHATGCRSGSVYDWFGSLGKASAGFWRRLREGGVDVRCYNPPRLDQPLGWIGRDHRKCLVVDGQVAFVTGLCVGRMWEGAPERGLAGWRDTGVEVRGPAVAEVAHAFADTWAAMGAPLAPDEVAAPGPPARAARGRAATPPPRPHAAPGSPRQ